MSSVLLGGPPAGASAQTETGAMGATQTEATPPVPPGWTPAESAGRSSAVTVIAGVGVLLLAMGVGVLIGRSSAPSKNSAPAQVITVAPSSSAGAATTPTTTPATTPTATPTTSEPAKGSSSSKNGSAGASGTGASGTGAAKGSGGGGSGAAPAPSNSGSSGSGKSYEEKSKNLPNVVSTGG